MNQMCHRPAKYRQGHNGERMTLLWIHLGDDGDGYRQHSTSIGLSSFASVSQGVALTEAEQSVKLALQKEGRSSRYISSEVVRDREAVVKVIQRGAVCGGCRRRGARCKLCKRVVRLLLRAASSGLFAARQLQEHSTLMTTVRRVQQLITAEPIWNWERMPSAPKLLPEQPKIK